MSPEAADQRWVEKSETDKEGRTWTYIVRIIGNTPIIKEVQLRNV